MSGSGIERDGPSCLARARVVLEGKSLPSSVRVLAKTA